MANLALKSIHQLLKETKTFLVPSYQRGYRWTEMQVKQLLDDICSFWQKCEGKPENTFYCLQPLVVSENKAAYSVIDGQQRLTTIYLILSYLKKQPYEMLYADEKKIHKAFLQAIDCSKKEDNIDYYHICTAYETIGTWFVNGKNMDEKSFFDALGAVKVIWYAVGEMDNSKQIDIFTRLNIGKIPLTNAELIKALFLQKTASEQNKDNDYKRLKIASEWDQIEYALRNNTFWNFIYGTSEKKQEVYENRIEFIFDLITDKKKDDIEYFTFNYFQDQTDLDKKWLEIKAYFQTFDDWYQDRTLYHLIGFLIEMGVTAKALREEAEKTLSKSAFKNVFLKSKIKNYVDITKIDELLHSDGRIRNTLLLFNILTIWQNKKSNIRFPFDSFKEEDWDIEHIHSTTPEEEEKCLKSILEYYTNTTKENEQVVAIERLELPEKELANKIFNAIHNKSDQAIYDEVLEHFKAQGKPNNGIGNLALLDSKTNRSYKNALFPIKRSIILQKDMNNTFIPICTKNAFTKAYSRKNTNVMFWEDSDAADYKAAIQSTISNFLDKKI